MRFYGKIGIFLLYSIIRQNKNLDVSPQKDSTLREEILANGTVRLAKKRGKRAFLSKMET